MPYLSLRCIIASSHYGLFVLCIASLINTFSAGTFTEPQLKITKQPELKCELFCKIPIEAELYF